MSKHHRASLIRRGSLGSNSKLFPTTTRKLYSTSVTTVIDIDPSTNGGSNYEQGNDTLRDTDTDTDADADTDTDTDSTGRNNNCARTSRRRPTIRYFYNDVYEVLLPPRHRFPMGKYRQVRTNVQDRISKLPQKEREQVDCDFKISPFSTVEELSTTHELNYIERFLRGDQTEKEQRNVGFPWSTEGVDRALSSVGGTVAACCFVCDEMRQQRRRNPNSDSSYYSPTWAAHIAGGTHHAFYDYGEGFSVFSDMAVAANVVLERYSDVIQNNILMIDLDVHQGNGNAVLFQQNDRVYTFSLNCAGNYFSQKQKSDLDIELPVGTTDGLYLSTLNHWLKRFRIAHYNSQQQQQQQQHQYQHRWDLIIYQAGVDVLDDDRLGRMSLSSKGVQRRNELVYEFAHDLEVPLVICMGGGYPRTDDGWNSIIDEHTNVFYQAHRSVSMDGDQ